MSNVNFTGVRNDQYFTSVNTGKLNVENLNERNGVHRVVGYAPVSFATLAATGVVPLMIAPGQTAQSTFEAGALRVPYGALILRAVVTNNGTAITGATSFQIGFAAASGTTASNLLNVALVADVNSGLVLNPVAADFGSAGFVGGNFLKVATTSGGDPVDAFVTVDPAAAITAGDLRVLIEYMLL
jgi:hypothetical protein